MTRTQRPVTNSHCPGTCVDSALFLLRGSHGTFLKTSKWKMDFAFCRPGRSENLDPSSPKFLPASPGTKPRSHITIQIYFSAAWRTPDFARESTISDFPFRFQMFPFEMCTAVAFHLTGLKLEPPSFHRRRCAQRAVQLEHAAWTRDMWYTIYIVYKRS